jgi:hypothetical protein
MLPLMLVMVGIVSVVLLWIVAPVAVIAMLVLWLIFPASHTAVVVALLLIIGVLLLERRSRHWSYRTPHRWDA